MVAAFAALILMLSIAWWLKIRCDEDPSIPKGDCFSDIVVLYQRRGFAEGIYPYVHGNGEVHKYEPNPDGDLEYPPRTGLIIAAGVATAGSERDFLRSQMLIIGATLLIAVAVLAWRVKNPWRIALFLLTPTVARYAIYNYDVPAVAAMCLGIIALARARHLLAGIAFGLGAAVKVFPGALVPVAAFEGWRRARWKGAGAALGGSILAFGAVSLPVYLMNRDAFWLTWTFHSERPANQQSLLSLLHRAFTGTTWDQVPPLNAANLISFVVLLLGILGFATHRALRSRPIDSAGLAGAVLAAWLLVTKVYSAQFMLWVLPLFALVRLPVPLWFGSVFIDAALQVLIHRRYTTPAELGVNWQPFFDLITVARSVFLAGIIWFCLTSPGLVRQRERTKV